jgi:PKD repeat protein
MNKLFLLLVLPFFSFSLSAQYSTGGIPESFKRNLEFDNNIEINVPALRVDLSSEDIEQAKRGLPLKYAQAVYADIDVLEAGSWIKLEDGSKICRLKVTSEGAKALGIHFDEFYMPENASLFIYNENKRQVTGAFTSINNRSCNSLETELIQGDVVLIEYYEPVGVTDMPILHIAELSYAFREVHFLDSYTQREFGDSESCQINVNCSPVGDNWQDEKKGVARISIKIGGGYYWCSGSLINNTSENCFPYFLTADHCTDNFTATDMESWIFYFHYEAPTCENPTSISSTAYKTFTGAKHVSNASGSDFFLLYLETYVPSGWDVYYNGWNRSTTATASGVGIHHPSGDIKKISTFSGTPISSTWSGASTGAHWRISWSSNANGTGVTEGGSSGSPLFDINGRIIGDLTGGSSQCTSTSFPDYYGKISYSWISNGSTTNKQLKPWLDPLNNGVTVLNGKYHTCEDIIPIADFSASDTVIYKAQTVSFTDLSSGLPNWWKWDFYGAVPSSSFDQNKTVTYNTPGIYNVRLIAKNLNGRDTLIKQSHIKVLDTNPLAINFAASDTIIEMGGVINFSDQSTGSPFFWNWEFEGATPSVSTSKNPASIQYAQSGRYKVKLTITNTVDTLSLIKESYILVTDTNEIIAGLTSETQCVGMNIPVAFNDTSNSFPISWSWSFEGGTPSESTLQNPVVNYLIPGEYDVELIVSNGNNIDTISYLDYISVYDTIPLLSDFTASNTVIFEGESVSFSNLSMGSYSEISWFFEGGTPNVSNIANPIIAYNNDGVFQVKLSLANCFEADSIIKNSFITVKDTSSGVAEINNSIFSLYPNPSKDVLVLKFEDNRGIGAKAIIRDSFGRLMSEKNISSNRIEFDISEFASGLYSIEIISSTIRAFRKVAVVK